jgi:hypothetical protein
MGAVFQVQPLIEDAPILVLDVMSVEAKTCKKRCFSCGAFSLVNKNCVICLIGQSMITLKNVTGITFFKAKSSDNAANFDALSLLILWMRELIAYQS